MGRYYNPDDFIIQYPGVYHDAAKEAMAKYFSMISKSTALRSPARTSFPERFLRLSWAPPLHPPVILCGTAPRSMLPSML